jgi:trehalose 6-phosphate phosphatase
VKDLLAPANRAVLARLASSKLLLAFDYDGTLAPFVDDPDQARMRGRTRHLLERLARAYPCVVISGRAQQDLLRRLRGTGVLEIIGNHGLEPRRRTDGLAALVRGWTGPLHRALSHLDGVVVEDKVFSLGVHYRRAARRDEARSAILRVAATLDAVRVVDGHCIVNLIPRGAPHKGLALEAARQQLWCDAALYVGDDESDEDVFVLEKPGRLVTVRVGRNSRSRASFFIRDQRRIDHFLSELARCRPEARTMAAVRPPSEVVRRGGRLPGRGRDS